MAGIDRTKVQGSFHRQAGTYDEHARVQKRVVADLLEQVREQFFGPERILDIGCGTGALPAGLHNLYPQARIFGVDLALGMCRAAASRVSAGSFIAADAESLPFSGGAFDLVTSASTYQWLSTLDDAFPEAGRVLKSGGIFLFALFGERTLFELKDAYRLALKREGEGEDVTHGFFSRSCVEKAMLSAGFACCSVSSTLEVEYHPDVPAMLKSLKRIGAGNAAPRPATGLAGRRRTLGMMEIYREKYACTEGIPATYEVIYGMGRRP